MELRQYLAILIKQWWIILPTTFVALTGGFMFSYTQTPIYEATSTYLTTLDTAITADRDTTIYGLDTLTGRQRIFVTYCEVMISGAVRDNAFRMLSIDPTSELAADYDVFCANLPETNVLLLTVQGPAPDLVTNLNAAIGIAGTAQANAIYVFFPLQQLDSPYLEETPISPQYTQNGVLGGAFGLVLGISAALLLEYLKRPSDQIAALSIRNQEIGIFNSNYFQRRFQEELDRASLRDRPISMGILKLHTDEDFILIPEQAQNAIIRKVALGLENQLNRGHLIAYIQPMTFGILLIETPSEEAAQITDRLQHYIREQVFEIESGYKANFTSSAGIVSSGGRLKSFKEIQDAAFKANSTAQESGSPMHIINAAPRPFVYDTQDMMAIAATEDGDASHNDTDNNVIPPDSMETTVKDSVRPSPNASETPFRHVGNNLSVDESINLEELGLNEDDLKKPSDNKRPWYRVGSKKTDGENIFTYTDDEED